MRADSAWAGRLVAAALLLAGGTATHANERLPLADAHIHYSEVVWDVLSPRAAHHTLVRAGVRHAVIFGVPHEGALRLAAEEPARYTLFVQPYRVPEDRHRAWYEDPRVLEHLRERVATGIYRGIGEFHLHSGQTDTPIVDGMLALAREHDLYLLAHSDTAVIEGFLDRFPDLKVIWAHAGAWTLPMTMDVVMGRYPQLYVELSMRDGDIAPDGTLDPRWAEVLVRYADRFMVGIDTFSERRWTHYDELAERTRGWLAQLPDEVAERIAWKNAHELFGGEKP
ncbi:amidohydrolase family protein [Ectothiorhodospiraceae bacterium 2226]|nr:amidohydrolase family protein [Ectothiorhodospiraceae bacterium 2226]